MPSTKRVPSKIDDLIKTREQRQKKQLLQRNGYHGTIYPHEIRVQHVLSISMPLREQ